MEKEIANQNDREKLLEIGARIFQRAPKDPPKDVQQMIEEILGEKDDALLVQRHESLLKRLKDVKDWEPELLLKILSNKSENHKQAVKSLMINLLKEKIVEPNKFIEIFQHFLGNSTWQSRDELNYFSDLLFELFKGQSIQFFDLLCIVKPVFDGLAAGKDLMLSILGKMFDDIENMRIPLKERLVDYIDLTGNVPEPQKRAAKKPKGASEEELPRKIGFDIDGNDDLVFDDAGNLSVRDFLIDEYVNPNNNVKLDEGDNKSAENVSRIQQKSADLRKNDSQTKSEKKKQPKIDLKEVNSSKTKPNVEKSEKGWNVEDPDLKSMPGISKDYVRNTKASNINVSAQPATHANIRSIKRVHPVDDSQSTKKIKVDNPPNSTIPSSANLVHVKQTHQLIRIGNKLNWQILPRSIGTPNNLAKTPYALGKPPDVSKSNSEMPLRTESPLPLPNSQFSLRTPNKKVVFVKLASSSSKLPNDARNNTKQPLKTVSQTWTRSDLNQSSQIPILPLQFKTRSTAELNDNLSKVSSPAKKPENRAKTNTEQHLKTVKVVGVPKKNSTHPRKASNPPDIQGASSLEYQKYLAENERQNIRTTRYKNLPNAQNSPSQPSNLSKEKTRSAENPNMWTCPECTSINRNSRTECGACKEPKADSNVSNYRQLMELEEAEIVPNLEAIECPICCVECQPYQGVTLRDCLHAFCKDCLKNHIQYCTDAAVKCPYADKTYSCGSVLQDREIRVLVTGDVYDKYLENRLKLAQHVTENSYQCKTPDCQGWWIYDPRDHVKTFACPVCKRLNCMTCEAIHSGMNCHQYKKMIQTNEEFKDTDQTIHDMVARNEAMNCPQCQVVVQKVDGCDWIVCTLCKTELCWVTKKRRRGPDGCHCKENGKGKCHPKCKNCH